MKIDEIKAYLEANKDSKEVQDFIGTFAKPVDFETAKKFIESDPDGKKYLQSYADGRVTKGIETWQANNLPKVLDSERAKWKAEFAPEDTPDQKRIKEMEKTLAAMKAETEAATKKAERERRVNMATKLLSEKKVPADYAEWLVDESDEATQEKTNKYADWFIKQINSATEERLKKTGGHVPPRPIGEPQKGGIGFTYEKT